jgi:hypothetical protein
MAKGTYVGFLKLKRELASKPGVTNPAGLAASIGVKKYGRKAMQQHAAKGESFRPKS